MTKVYLIESVIKKLKGSDKRQTLFDTKRSGLVLVLGKQKIDSTTGKDITKKSWYFNYRPKNAEPTRLFIGQAENISRAAAILRIRKIENDIFNNEDPFTIKKKMEAEHALDSLINKFCESVLLPSTYSAKYISSMKSVFNVWIFQNPKNPKLFNKYFDYSIKDKKISKIKTTDVLQVFNSVKSKSGYSANRLIAYLKVVFNWAISERILVGDNPAKIKAKQLFKELEANNILTQQQYDNIVRLTFVVDERNGTIDFDHYLNNGLEIIPCLAITWAMLTGRRCSSEGFNIKFSLVENIFERGYSYNNKIKKYEITNVKSHKLHTKKNKIDNTIQFIQYEK